MPALPATTTTTTTTTDDDDATPDDDDDARDDERTYARNKTIDLKRENVYALVNVRARMSSSSSTLTRKRTSVFGQSEQIFTEILRDALELARGKVGGKDVTDAMRVVHFETKKESRRIRDWRGANEEEGFGVVRIRDERIRRVVQKKKDER
tara:strand:- start:64 stop:519 length:456 start_codon:yes stop_codon:yes gene_type:complete